MEENSCKKVSDLVSVNVNENYIKTFALSLLGNYIQNVANDERWVSKKLFLLENAKNNFYISDQGAVMHNQVDNMSPYGNIGFLVPSIEIYMPISPKYTLFILGEETSKLKPDLSTIQASDELIEFVNYLQIGSACKQIVSKNNDFNFAKKILSEYEHLKTEQINKFIIQ